MTDNIEVPSEAGPSSQPLIVVTVEDEKKKKKKKKRRRKDTAEVPSEAGPSSQPPLIAVAVEDEKKKKKKRRRKEKRKYDSTTVDNAEGPSEAGPSGDVAAGADDDKKKKKKKKKRKERIKPREKKIVLPPRPATAERGAMQLLDTAQKRGVGRRGDPVHVIEKKLTETDANINQCRLQLTPAFVDRVLTPQFLTGAELASLQPGTKGLIVKAVDRANNEYDLNLRRCSSLNQYRILNWSQFVVDHELRAGLTTTIWVFRWRSDNEDDDGKIGMVILYYDETDEHDVRQRHLDAQLLDGRIIDAMNGLLSLDAQRGTR